MGVETASASSKSGGAATANNRTRSGGASTSKTPPAAPPVKTFANQLQKDIEDATVEVMQSLFCLFWLSSTPS